MHDDGGNRFAAGVRRREERVQLGHRHLPAEPVEATEEDELQLLDDRARDAEEEVVEAPVLEVVFDPGAPHPADAAVDHDHLPVVDVTEAAQVPARRPVVSEWADLHTRLRCAHDADLDTRPVSRS